MRVNIALLLQDEDFNIEAKLISGYYAEDNNTSRIRLNFDKGELERFLAKALNTSAMNDAMDYNATRTLEIDMYESR